MKKISFFYLIILFAFALNGFSQDITLSEIDNYNDWGKKALVVNNSIIELVIFPEIGGRVLYYGFPDDEYLAVNESEMDKTYDADTDGTGPWKSWGYGGYKVWPAPQSVWNWPPPPHLDWGNYNFTVEHESPDSVIIFLESEEENLRAPGLVFTRRFKAYKGSTKVTIEQTIINNNSSAQNWSVWDVTQAVVNHSDNNDYSNFSVYFPANKSEFITGPAYGDLDDEVTQINDEISMFKYNSSKTHAKLFCYLENGWECFTDERDKQSYIKHFPSLAGNHPDEGANFEIYSGGGYIEIEVLSPITNIAGNGGEYTYTQNWYATKTNGAVQNVNHAAVVNEYLSFNSETSNITGAYGIITSGSLKLRFLDSSGEELELSEAIPVYSSMAYLLDSTISVPDNTESIEILAYDANNNEVGIVDYWPNSNTTNNAQIQINELTLWPTIVKRNAQVNIEIPEVYLANKISIIDIYGRVVLLENVNESDKLLNINLKNYVAGVYFVHLESEKTIYKAKFIIE